MAALPSSVNRARRLWLRVAGLFTAGVLAFGWLPAAAQPPASAGPARIVSFVPAVTEMLFALGVGQRVIGVSAYDRFPLEVRTLPQVGGLLDPNVERVLALRPDLVVVYRTQSELREQLRRAGIAQFDYAHRDLADVTGTVRAIGQRVGAAAVADRLARDMEQQLSTIRQRGQRQGRPKTLLVFGREPGSLRRILASGGYGFLHDLLEVAGGADVLADVKRESVELSTETVLARAPEVIIELRYGQALQPAELTRVAREWDALTTVPAVRRGSIFVLQGDEFVVPGPRLVDAARMLAEVIHSVAP